MKCVQFFHRTNLTQTNQSSVSTRESLFSKDKWLTWYIISFISSFRRWMNNSVKRQLFTLSYPPFKFMRKYVFARGSLKVLSSLYQNFISGSSSMHLGVNSFTGPLHVLWARTEKSHGMNSFFEGRCSKKSISGGSLHNSNKDGEISSSA